MQCFKDVEGREFTLRLTLGTVEKIKAKLGADILNINSVSDSGLPLIQELITNDVLLFDVVVAMIEDQLNSKGITRDEFLDSIDGDKVQEVSEKFFKEVDCFFTARGRKWIAAAILKDRNLYQQKVEELLQGLVGEK